MDTDHVHSVPHATSGAQNRGVIPEWRSQSGKVPGKAGAEPGGEWFSVLGTEQCALWVADPSRCACQPHRCAFSFAPRAVEPTQAPQEAGLFAALCLWRPSRHPLSLRRVGVIKLLYVATTQASESFHIFPVSPRATLSLPVWLLGTI